MNFSTTPLQDAWLIGLEPIADSRGSFARTYCEREFAQHGLNTRWVQFSQSYSAREGTLRGMHYQVSPHAEVKLVRCIRGAIYDCIVDLRPASSTYRHWFGVMLTAAKPGWLYVPEGFAHGFVTLCSDAEVEYMISAEYTPQAARGFRYNDEYFGIVWPHSIEVLSPKDASWPDYDPAAGLL
jgi:dTDP-4-dehydrorhamnose 3,5-epimerase